MKSFQEALEQRAADAKNIEFDKYTIKKAACDVVAGLFGNLGGKCIAVAGWSEGVLALRCERSAWRSEIILHKQEIIDGINSKCKANIISEVRV